jgi:insecticidal toxin complex protein TccC
VNVHHNTPKLLVIDPRSQVLRSVDYCRYPDEPTVDSRISRQMLDEVGRPHESWDPRLWGAAPKPNLKTHYGLDGQPLLTDSVDAGWQLSLFNEAGSPCSFWDARGSQHHSEYDPQQRPIAVSEQAAGEPPRVVERLDYADSGTTFTAHNQCGRLIRHDDPAGARVFPDYGLVGAVLVEERRFLTELETPDWPQEPDARDVWLEQQTFITRHVFHPTGDIERQTDAMNNVRTFGYDMAGSLSEAWLLQAGDGKTSQRLVSDIQYNAYGQIESETAGNEVITRVDYSAEDGRLIRLMAQVGDQKPLQDLHYRYDPVGNIVDLEDKSQAVTYFNSQRIDPINRYRYDSLYQLVEAKGWEVSTPSHGPALPDLLPTPLDPNQRRNYTQHFDYDPAGNLIRRHHSGAPGFSMFTSATCNRSLAQRDDGTLPGEPDIASGFDACGNQLELQRGLAMRWDCRNQLSRVTLVQREDDADDYEWYAYDRPGHRLRKVFFSQTNRRTLRAEVRYLPGLEIHRQADGKVHHAISAEAGRCSVRALHWPEGTHADQLRYSLGDHLGSSTLELDDEAGVLTQEHYYAFGGTACWAGKNAVVAKYKTIRYSGKERDATGLYYYGYRYYAPWLQRWINPDPAGDGDGPNHYAMVGNNPINFIDGSGLQRVRFSDLNMVRPLSVWASFAIFGFGLGWLAGNAQTGAAVGVLLGAGFLSYLYWVMHQRSRPEVIAARIEKFADRRNMQIYQFAAEEGLTHEETVSFAAFAVKELEAQVGVSMFARITRTEAGKIYGYVGPSSNGKQAIKVLNTDNNPVPGMKRLGYKVLLLRNPPSEQSSPTSGGAIAGQFDSENFVSVAGRRRGGGTSQPGPSSTPPQGVEPALAQQWEIDTQAVDSILGNSDDPRHKSVCATIGNLREGRLAAVTWHHHEDNLWSADLKGFPGSKKRGAHRLMVRHQGGLNYRVEGVRNPH